MPTAHSGTFTCPNTQATASQAKEPEFCQHKMKYGIY